MRHVPKVMTSEELSVLRSVLDQWCEKRGVPVTSDEAETAAADILHWYAFGIRNPVDLFEIVRPEHRR